MATPEELGLPNTYDLQRFQDIHLQDHDLLKEYISKYQSGSINTAHQIIETNPQGIGKAFTAKSINAYVSAILDLERLTIQNGSETLDEMLKIFQNNIDNFDFVGSWTLDQEYKVGNFVFSPSGDLYLCIKDGVYDLDDETAWLKLGLIGDPGNIGFGLNYRGKYDPTTEYNPRDMVVYENGLYVAKTDNTSITPGSSPTDWCVALTIEERGIFVDKVAPAELRTGDYWWEILDKDWISPEDETEPVNVSLLFKLSDGFNMNNFIRLNNNKYNIAILDGSSEQNVLAYTKYISGQNEYSIDLQRKYIPQIANIKMLTLENEEISDFEWTQELIVGADGSYTLQLTENDNYLYIRKSYSQTVDNDRDCIGSNITNAYFNFYSDTEKAQLIEKHLFFVTDDINTTIIYKIPNDVLSLEFNNSWTNPEYLKGKNIYSLEGNVKLHERVYDLNYVFKEITYNTMLYPSIYLDGPLDSPPSPITMVDSSNNIINVSYVGWREPPYYRSNNSIPLANTPCELTDESKKALDDANIPYNYIYYYAYLPYEQTITLYTDRTIEEFNSISDNIPRFILTDRLGSPLYLELVYNDDGTIKTEELNRHISIQYFATTNIFNFKTNTRENWQTLGYVIEDEQYSKLQDLGFTTDVPVPPTKDETNYSLVAIYPNMNLTGADADNFNPKQFHSSLPNEVEVEIYNTVKNKVDDVITLIKTDAQPLIDQGGATSNIIYCCNYVGRTNYIYKKNDYTVQLTQESRKTLLDLGLVDKDVTTNTSSVIKFLYVGHPISDEHKQFDMVNFGAYYGTGTYEQQQQLIKNTLGNFNIKLNGCFEVEMQKGVRYMPPNNTPSSQSFITQNNFIPFLIDYTSCDIFVNYVGVGFKIGIVDDFTFDTYYTMIEYDKSNIETIMAVGYKENKFTFEYKDTMNTCLYKIYVVGTGRWTDEQFNDWYNSRSSGALGRVYQYKNYNIYSDVVAALVSSKPSSMTNVPGTNLLTYVYYAFNFDNIRHPIRTSYQYLLPNISEEVVDSNDLLWHEYGLLTPSFYYLVYPFTFKWKAPNSRDKATGNYIYSNVAGGNTEAIGGISKEQYDILYEKWPQTITIINNIRDEYFGPIVKTEEYTLTKESPSYSASQYVWFISYSYKSNTTITIFQELPVYSESTFNNLVSLGLLNENSSKMIGVNLSTRN